jgi:hypothetical protein
MLYETLTGRLPHPRGARDVPADQQNEGPLAPSTLLPSVPHDLSLLSMDLLRPSPAARPTASSVLERLGKTRGAPEVSLATKLPFVGRTAQLQVLEDAFTAVRRGRPMVAFVHGASGIGKTAVVERFLDELRLDRGVVILAGRCYERESVPYKALDGLVDALSHYLVGLEEEARTILPPDVHALARLFPVLNRVSGIGNHPSPDLECIERNELRRRAFRACTELFRGITARVPLVLWIDDLQWGDLDGAVLLRDLIRPPSPPPLLLIASYRSGDETSSACLRTLVAARSETSAFRDIPVDALSESELHELALALLGEAASGRAQAVAREAGGSPFLAVELARHAGGEGRASLEEMLAARKALLAEPAQRLLEVIAVAGQPVGERAAFAAANVRKGDDGAITELRAARFVRTSSAEPEGMLESYHDRIREAVVRSLDPKRLRAHHVGLARALESIGGADPETLAVHFEGAGDPRKAASYAMKAAAGAAAALAFDQAVRLYRWALDLHGLGDPARREVEIKLGDALAIAGRYGESAETLLAAAAGAPAALALELQRQAMERFFHSGRVAEGLAIARQVLGAVGLSDPATRGRTLASALYHRAWIELRGYHYREREPGEISTTELTRMDVCRSIAFGLGMIDPLRAADFEARFVILALRAGDPRRISQALCFEAEFLSGRGAPRRVPELLRTAQTIGERMGDTGVLSLVKQCAANAALFSGDLPRAVALCSEATAPMSGSFIESAYGQGINRLFSLVGLWWTGAVRDARRRLTEMLEEVEQRGDLLFSCTLRAAGAMTTLVEDEPERAQRELGAAMAAWTHAGFHIQHLCELQSRVQILLYVADGAGAHRYVAGRWPAIERSFILRNVLIAAWMYDARARAAVAAAAELGQASLVAAAARDAKRIEQIGTAWSSLAGPIRAAVAFVRGDVAGAERLLADAAGAFDAAHMALHAAAARRTLGQLIGGTEGQQLIDAADDWMGRQDIRSPARITESLVPGFPRGGAVPRRATLRISSTGGTRELH